MTNLHDLVAALIDAECTYEDVCQLAPLDILTALHAEIVADMRNDLARAGRAAALAHEVARMHPDSALAQAQAHWSMGSAVLFVPRYAESLAHYDQALAWYARAQEQTGKADLSPDVRVVDVVRVFCLNELGRYQEALAAAARAEAWLRDHPTPRVRLSLLINRSLLAGHMGDYPAMLTLADETIALAADLDSRAQYAMGWINRGYACIWLGRFDEAEAAIVTGQQAAAMAEEGLTFARAQINRAWLLRCTGRLFAALTLLKEAERGMAQAEGERATIALEQAGLYAQLRQLREAQAAAERAADLFDAQSMPLYSASAYLQAARLMIEQQRPSEAEPLLGKARQRAVGLGLAPLEAEIVTVAARAAALPPKPGAPQPRRKAARAALAAALEVLERGGLPREAHEARLALAAIDARMGHVRRARAGYRALLNSAPDYETLMAAQSGLGALLPTEQALPHLRAAADLAVAQRRALPMEELQARYSSETAHQHMALSRCLLDLGDVAGALMCIWEAKAGPLLDLRAAASALDSTAQSTLAAIKNELARWRMAAAEHQQKVRRALEAKNSDQAAYHRAEAERARSSAQVSEQQLIVAMHTLDDRVGQTALPSIAAVQAALPSDTCLLEYARIDRGFVCIVVHHDRPPQVRRIADGEHIKTLVSRWGFVACSDPHDPYPDQTQQRRQQVLGTLYQALLAPVADLLGPARRLLIAPSDLLSHVPWAALDAGGQPLGANLTISLTPSGAFWAAPFAATQAAGPPRVLGYAGAGERFLPYVQREIELVARIVATEDYKQDATSADLSSEPTPRLLHIACHGVTRPDAPICSHLELADGPFLLLEAQRLNLRGSELVTLSACETGERPNYGEMALALAGSFLCAGARTVLASLWAVDDHAAADLMQVFYARLMAGEPPAQALRSAQQHIRSEHPLHWAAFQLWEGAQRADKRPSQAENPRALVEGICEDLIAER